LAQIRAISPGLAPESRQKAQHQAKGGAGVQVQGAELRVREVANLLNAPAALDARERIAVDLAEAGRDTKGREQR
jgi:hypothetical protein